MALGRHRVRGEEEEEEISPNDKAWVDDSFVSREEAALSAQKLVDKSHKHKITSAASVVAMRTPWKKRAKFDLDEAANHLDD